MNIGRDRPLTQENRMSGALVALIQPYAAQVESLTAYKALVAIAALAWNVSLLSSDEQDQHIGEAATKLTPTDRTIFCQMVRSLMHRKRDLFPEDRRIVVNYEVSASARGYEVTVASTQLDSV